jgi:hypothetical protein
MKSGEPGLITKKLFRDLCQILFLAKTLNFWSLYIGHDDLQNCPSPPIAVHGRGGEILFAVVILPLSAISP